MRVVMLAVLALAVVRRRLAQRRQRAPAMGDPAMPATLETSGLVPTPVPETSEGPATPQPPAVSSRQSWITPGSAAAVAFLAAGVLVWALSLDAIELDDMTDVGLAPALPPGIWVSFGLVMAGCALAWRTGRSAVMAVGVLSTILVLHGLGVLGEPTMRFGVSWQHVGIADYIATHGSVDPRIDAYLQLAGILRPDRLLSEVPGLENAEPIADR